MRVALVGDYTFEEAATVEESIERAGSFRPDVALVDVMMPGGSGLEIIRYLKGDQRAAPRPLRRDLGVLGRGRPPGGDRGRRRGVRPQAVRPRRALTEGGGAARGAPGEALIRRAGGWLAARYQPRGRQCRNRPDRRARRRRDRRARAARRRRVRVRPRRALEPARLHERAGRREPRDDRCAAPRARGRRARPEPSRLRPHAQRRDPQELGAARA